MLAKLIFVTLLVSLGINIYQVVLLGKVRRTLDAPPILGVTEEISPTLMPTPVLPSDISQQLATIQETLIKIRADQRGIKLAVTPIPLPAGLSVSAPVAVTVYPERQFSSQTVGQTKPDQKYKVLDKQDDWYRIELEAGKTGWATSPILEESL